MLPLFRSLPVISSIWLGSGVAAGPRRLCVQVGFRAAKRGAKGSRPLTRAARRGQRPFRAARIHQGKPPPPEAPKTWPVVKLDSWLASRT